MNFILSFPQSSARYRLIRLRQRILLLFFSVSLVAFGADAPVGKIAVADLIRLINAQRFNAAEAEQLREVLRGLAMPQAAELPVENNADSEKILTTLHARYLHSGSRPAALAYARYLMFLSNYPAAMQVLKKIGASSKDDTAWLLTMADINMQLGDTDQARVYAERAVELLGNDENLSLSAPVVVSAVQGFRLYAIDERLNWTPNSPIILYVEIANPQFKVVNNEYRCSLTFGLELRDESGNIRDQNLDYGNYDPVYNGAVKELHATIYYRLPSALPAGKYTLRLLCVDSSAAQQAHGDISLNVISATAQTVERKVDAEGFQKALETNLWQNDEDQENRTTRKLENMLKGMEISRERSKLQGNLIGQ